MLLSLRPPDMKPEFAEQDLALDFPGLPLKPARVSKKKIKSLPPDFFVAGPLEAEVSSRCPTEMRCFDGARAPQRAGARWMDLDVRACWGCSRCSATTSPAGAPGVGVFWDGESWGW